MTFLQVKRALPTWVIILGIVLAISLGHASSGTANAADTNTSTTGQTAQTTTSTPTKTAPKPTATTAPKLKTIVSYSGTGQKNTPNFHVSANQWQISWACQPDSFGSGNLMVEVDNADGTPFDIVAVNEICDSSKHDVTIERGSGDFFLKVDADAPWQIQIQAVQ